MDCSLFELIEGDYLSSQVDFILHVCVSTQVFTVDTQGFTESVICMFV